MLKFINPLIGPLIEKLMIAYIIALVIILLVAKSTMWLVVCDLIAIVLMSIVFFRNRKEWSRKELIQSSRPPLAVVIFLLYHMYDTYM